MLTFAALTVCKLLGSMRYERTFLIIMIKKTQKTTNTNQPKVATFRLETASVRGRNLCRNCFSKKKKSVQSQSTNAGVGVIPVKSVVLGQIIPVVDLDPRG